MGSLRVAVTVLLAAVALAGCGPEVSFTPLNPSPRPFAPRDPMSVEVYTTALPQRPYVEVAALSAKGGHANEHVGAMRDEAGKLGCDAIVFTTMSTDATATGYNWKSSSTTTTRANSGSSATCVMWTEAPPAPPSATPPATP